MYAIIPPVFRLDENRWNIDNVFYSVRRCVKFPLSSQIIAAQRNSSIAPQMAIKTSTIFQCLTAIVLLVLT